MKMRDWGMGTGIEGDQVTADKLRDDVRTLAADMEQLLKATANHTGQQVAQVRAKAEESLKAARVRIAEAQESALARTRAASKAADEYVRDNPWQALAIVATAALAVGFLLAVARGSDSD
jgi:ElaB/YqjD/DUF883 family membrane-anchored ribosome-binding protein